MIMRSIVALFYRLFVPCLLIGLVLQTVFVQV
jgi:hypothetical protein